VVGTMPPRQVKGPIYPEHSELAAALASCRGALLATGLISGMSNVLMLQRDQGSANGRLGRDNLVYNGTNANDLFTIGVAGEVPLNSRLVVNTVGAANDLPMPEQCLPS
jgi:hypothetical protein